MSESITRTRYYRASTSRTMLLILQLIRTFHSWIDDAQSEIGGTCSNRHSRANKRYHKIAIHFFFFLNFRINIEQLSFQFVFFFFCIYFFIYTKNLFVWKMAIYQILIFIIISLHKAINILWKYDFWIFFLHHDHERKNKLFSHFVFQLMQTFHVNGTLKLSQCNFNCLLIGWSEPVLIPMCHF